MNKFIKFVLPAIIAGVFTLVGVFISKNSDTKNAPPPTQSNFTNVNLNESSVIDTGNANSVEKNLPHMKVKRNEGSETKIKKVNETDFNNYVGGNQINIQDANLDGTTIIGGQTFVNKRDTGKK